MKIESVFMLVVVLAAGLVFALFLRPPSGPAADPSHVISRGEAIDLAAHLEPGNFTVVEFFADW